MGVKTTTGAVDVGATIGESGVEAGAGGVVDGAGVVELGGSETG